MLIGYNLNFDIKPKEYHLNKEICVYNSDNNYIFYKYLNNNYYYLKLHSSIYILNVFCTFINNEVSSDINMAANLSRKFSSVFNNKANTNIQVISRLSTNITPLLYTLHHHIQYVHIFV